MSTQPKALFLADVMHNDPCSAAHHDAAAAELRRLHARLSACEDIAAAAIAECERLSAQRDALLHALRWIDKRCPLSLMEHELHAIHQEMAHDAGARARAAIKAVEGEKA